MHRRHRWRARHRGRRAGCVEPVRTSQCCALGARRTRARAGGCTLCGQSRTVCGGTALGTAGPDVRYFLPAPAAGGVLVHSQCCGTRPPDRQTLLAVGNALEALNELTDAERAFTAGLRLDACWHACCVALVFADDAALLGSLTARRVPWLARSQLCAARDGILERAKLQALSLQAEARARRACLFVRRDARRDLTT